MVPFRVVKEEVLPAPDAPPGVRSYVDAFIVAASLNTGRWLSVSQAWRITRFLSVAFRTACSGILASNVTNLP